MKRSQVVNILIVVLVAVLSFIGMSKAVTIKIETPPSGMHTRSKTLYIRGTVSDKSIKQVELFADGATIDEVHLECNDGIFETNLALTAGKTSVSTQALVDGHYIESGIIVYRDCTVSCGIDSRDAILNANRHNLAHPVKIISGRSMIPLREYVMLFGGEVGWDNETKRITVIVGRRESSVALGSDTATIDGTTVTCDPAVTSIHDTAYVPSRLCAEMLGGGVTWDGKLRMVSISVP